MYHPHETEYVGYSNNLAKGGPPGGGAVLSSTADSEVQRAFNDVDSCLSRLESELGPLEAAFGLVLRPQIPVPEKPDGMPMSEYSTSLAMRLGAMMVRIRNVADILQDIRERSELA